MPESPKATAKVRNMTGEPRRLPAAGRVIQPTEVITLPAHLAQLLAEQPGWDLVAPRKPASKGEE
ncbi:hypothetical protein JOF56_005713 [Kibdelosporangium banguiense]|uniref:Uncharacterized protein n=1 Tax=Kibdelosporangium banguiense TaxID=1365924 RepID=A0ABS4TN36_9PSEU|nr:hypothetical protein [Kibdelosporangium banguiense]MBP2325328.1 hypothetical protein [Kibdelosporangium banguiense]